MSTFAILPVKRFDHAKQRLREGLSAAAVEELAESMFAGVLGALTRVRGIEQVIVVTAEPRAQRRAREHGAIVIDDDEHGHNAAALRGIDRALRCGAGHALLVPGDCPLLDPDEVDDLITRAASAGPEALVVPDRHGTGTNALLLTPPDALEPAFGPGSCLRHQRNARARGVSAEVIEVPSLALDIDTPEDLELAC
jgi:2-phospho-L-lactate/phosphoenolpyruvate guanylyltransferase